MRPPSRILAATGIALAAALLIFSWPDPESRPPRPPSLGTHSTTETSVELLSAVDVQSPAPIAPSAERAYADFEAWTAEYRSADPARRAELISEGERLAAARRPHLARLIAADPREALRQAVPMAVRQDLPAAITAQLETRISERAFFGVKAALDESGNPIVPLRREIRTSDGELFDAFVFGRRTTQKTTENAFVSGIALDRAIAVDERPLRVLEGGERPAATQSIVETCVVSGKSTAVDRDASGELPPITEETPAIEVAGTIHYLCSGGHILAAEEDLIAQEGATGGPSKPTGTIPSSQATGVRSLLWMRVAFPETNQDPQSERDSYEEMRQVNDFFVENSFGILYVQTTVTPLLVLPRTEAWYKVNDNDGAVLSDARAVSKAAGYDPANYDLDAVIYRGGPGGFAGQAYVGGKGCWLKSSSVGVAAHEFGHNFGLWHANFWNTSGRSIIGDGTHVEYGNSFDTMGAASAGSNHFNAEHKNELDWIPDQFFHAIRQSGTYRIYTMDQPRLESSRRYALRVRKDSARYYWAEFRQKFSSNAWMMSGLSINWSPWAQSAGGAHLLDTTPGTPDDKTDSPLTIGRTLSDLPAGVHITPIGKGGTTPESMDVVVNIGTFPENLPPSLSLSASSETVGTNAVVTLTAAANDPNGDALSYAWDFGDKSFSIANAAIVTKSWSTAGEYVVRCTASDMKGGTASSAVVIRVGSPTTLRISGTVTLNGQPLPNVRMHNGQTGSNYRGSYSNSDGSYIIAGLTAGSHTISASLYGYSFSGVSATAGSTNVNFAATETPIVTLSIPDADAREASANPGTFRLTRTGSTTSALTVNTFAPTGTASRGSDYTLSPDVTSANSIYTLTIPAGAATLDVIATPADDSTSEGPETATLEILPGTGYVLGATATATLTITDSDSSLPVVSFRVVDSSASESGDPATFVVSRTGPTTNALTVPYAVSTGAGQAGNGTDYTSIGTNIVIPAGASTATRTIAPIQDTSVEGTETITITVSSNAAYIRESNNSGTAYLEDDDQSIVTITAPDNAAAEAGSDPATFVVNRTGSLATPLTVYYTLGGSALHGTDYFPLPGLMTIPAGASVGSFTITPVDDAIGEAQQTIIAQLRSSDDYVVANPSSATANLVDNDVPIVSVTVSDGTVSEPSSTGVFRFATTGTGSGNITIRYTVTGTAVSGEDFQSLSGTVSIGRNTTADVTVTPIDDTIAERVETITITIDDDPAYTTHLDTSATMRLQDDEAPVVHVTAADTSLGENASTGQYYLSRLGSTTDALTVNYTMSGTATNGTDYQLLPGSIDIAAGATGADLLVTPIQDSTIEGTEAITLSLADGAYTIGLGTSTLYLPDDDSSPVQVRFASSNGSGAESIGAVNVPITLSASPSAPVTVEVRINGGTGTHGVDYQFSPTLVTFAAGETSKTVPLEILNDAFVESNQTVILQLLNPNGATLGTSGFTYTITDNDTAPAATVGFASAAANGLESASTPPLVVTLNAVQAGTVSVHYAVTGGTASSGADFTLAEGTLNFAAGETARVIPGIVIDDATSESAETIIVTLDSPSGAVLSPIPAQTYTITDNDAAIATIAATDADATESGDQGLFTLTRTGSINSSLTVNLTIGGSATNGADYQTIAATASFTANQATTTLSVKPYLDGSLDGDETVIVGLLPGASYTVGAATNATVTISENATLISIAATDANAAEAGTESGVFTLTRAGDATNGLEINVILSGTASGSDYSTSTIPVSMAAGETTATITITAVDDLASEVAETVIAAIAGGNDYIVSSPSAATITITDDDSNFPPEITLVSPTKTSVAIPANVGLVVEATVEDDGKPLNPGAVTTTWSKQSGPGTVTFGNANLPATTAQFSANGLYVIRLTAADGEHTATRDLAVQVGGAPAFTGQNINTPTPLGSFTESNGTYTVQGGGSNITGTSDRFFFLHQGLSGDGEIKARVVSVTGGAASAKAGVMFRNDTSGGSRMAFTSIYGPASTGNAYSHRVRLTDNASISNTGVSGAPAYPRWFRLVRSGDSFSGYTSTDGQQWSQIGSTQTITAKAEMLVGLAVTSNNSTALCTAVFDNVSLSSWPANVGAVVDAGPDQSATLPGDATLTGSVSDDGKPQPPGAVTLVWSKVSGPGNVDFGSPTSATTTCSLAAAGAYVLRLTADDGEVKTFDEVGINATQPSVSVTATDSTATEAGATTAAFTLTRTGDTTSELAVQFTLSGTATNGEDYTPLAEEMVIAAGQSTKVITVTPLADAEAEGPESVSLEIGSSPDYAIGAASTATATIADLPIDAWRFNTFGADANNPQISGDLIDLDLDGLPILLEYACGLTPDGVDSSPVTIGMEAGFVTLTYRRAIDATDLTFQVQAAPTPGAWGPATTTDEIVDTIGGVHVIKAKLPLGELTQMFLRLEVTR